MKRNITCPPIIIMGMHRSGTSMISHILEDLGVFMGLKKQRDHEALFFFKINEWLLSQSSGAWDHPQSIHYLLENKQVRSLALSYIRFIMQTPRIVTYLGLKHYLKYRSLKNLDVPWGWKDPRNTFTLPLWLDIFPDAKVIHIYRNGIDVANSLRVRATKDFLKRPQIIQNNFIKCIYVFRPKQGGFTSSLRCASLEGGFSLWEDYINEGKMHVDRLKDRALEIKYEDFINAPETHLITLANFCNISAPEDVVSEIIKSVRKTRSYAYKKEMELVTFADKMSSRLSLFGY